MVGLGMSQCLPCCIAWHMDYVSVASVGFLPHAVEVLVCLAIGSCTTTLGIVTTFDTL